MGAEGDMNDRMTLQRVDDQARRKKIDQARKLIYQRGAPVDGKRVKSILNSESLVPTRVSRSFYIQIATILTSYRTPFQINFSNSDLISF